MRLLLVTISLLLVQPILFAQFPYTRTLEIRSGQQRPSINTIVQDHHGLLWLGSDLGLLRTDGERVEVILRNGSGAVTALCANEEQVFAAIGDGLIIRCDASSCDTLLIDERTQRYRVNTMLIDTTRHLWIGTHGAGILRLDLADTSNIRSIRGLRDEHVNDLALLADGKVVAATDQGLALCDSDTVIESFGEGEGAPDNLTISVAVDDNGIVWAGTDRSGVFSWNIGLDEAGILDTTWAEGEVNDLVVQGDLVWIGTQSGSVSVHASIKDGYNTRPGGGAAAAIQQMIVDRDGAVWWCNGTDQLYRSDAAILFVPAHEGKDLRNASALCSDRNGRIWFATSEGLFHHAAAFAGDHQIEQVPVTVDQRTPIVSLASTEQGTIWAATFGAGVIAIPQNGAIRYYNSSNSPINDNVLSVKVRGQQVWFATLEGLVLYTPLTGMVDHPLPFPGFVFDVLPLNDSTALAATDGNGVLQLNLLSETWEVLNAGEGTFYSLAIDTTGAAWAAGPGTGFCKVSPASDTCHAGSRAPFDADLFSIAYHAGRLIAFGSTGTLAYDPITNEGFDLTARLGLDGIQAELNAVTKGRDGSLWLATDKGLVRMRPTSWHFNDRILTVIRSLQVGTTDIQPADEIVLPHDHDRITIQYAGIYWVDPGAVHFEYRLLGADQSSQITRDREVFYSSLSPGNYTFQVRAFTGASPDDEEWVSVPFTITAPVWQRPWSILLMVVLLIGITVLLLKMRERRIRERERMEQEKVRFQLEALRSQVDPHFLFNSFNTLVELIESDADIAVAHVEKLSLFFRNILQVRDKELVQLEEELGLLANYFALEKHRFNEAISMAVEVPEADRHLSIVPLTLQLLVENALKHNVATVKQPLHITVRSEAGAIVVSNPVQPRLTAPRSMGFGLDSIRKRYKALTDRPIKIEQTAETFSVTIPLIVHKP